MLDSSRRLVTVGGVGDQEVTDSNMLQLDDRDRISNLPRDLIHCILARLSVDDAAITSVISKEWRYLWAMNPKLVLDKLFFSRLTSKIDKDAHQSAFSRAVEMIILVHSARLLSFYLYIPPRLDQRPVTRWIQHFSNKGIKYLELNNYENNAYEIPSCLFDCVGLICLNLSTWIFNAPNKCTSFKNLKRVQLCNISFNADVSFGIQLTHLSVFSCTGIKHLGCQFTNVNTLTALDLSESEQIDWRWLECTTQLRFLALRFTSIAKFNLNKPIDMIKLLSNIPSLNVFCTSGFALEHWRLSSDPKINGLATKLDNLTGLVLHQLGCYNLPQFSYALSLSRCLPNLQRLEIVLVDDKSINPIALIIKNSIDCRGMSLCPLRKLIAVKILDVVNSRFLSHFLKFLLASSPSLKVMSLFFSREVTDRREKLKIMRDLQHFPRSSLAAQVLWYSPINLG